MRIIWGYFKERAWFALLLVLCVGLFAQVLRLYDLPAEAVGYASLLCAAAFAVWTAVDLLRCRERVRYLESLRDVGDLDERVRLVITDIEMPQMDGHRLTKLIKSDKQFTKLPVVIFSSMINEEMHRKGKELGANEQLTKPEIGRLVEIIDHLLAIQV